jgi:hypothetical protein
MPRSHHRCLLQARIERQRVRASHGVNGAPIAPVTASAEGYQADVSGTTTATAAKVAVATAAPTFIALLDPSADAVGRQQGVVADNDAAPDVHRARTADAIPMRSGSEELARVLGRLHSDTPLPYGSLTVPLPRRPLHLQDPQSLLTWLQLGTADNATPTLAQAAPPPNMKTSIPPIPSSRVV